MNNDIAGVLDRVDGDLCNSLDRLFSLLRIESVSTDPAYAQACREAARWLGDDLAAMGFEAAVRETPGHPMVVGHYTPPGGGDAPHVLFYGHYDVQPVDPLDLWEKPPFEPWIADAPGGAREIRARGACDDKGQLMTFLEACRAHMAARGRLPVRVTVLLEGEEESGSASLDPFLEANAGELKAGIALVCDTGMWDPETPGITTRLRGMVGMEVIVKGPARDLHSGLYGGAARNPIRVLSRILGDIHADDGRVAVPGFYDGVAELPPAVRDQWNALDFDQSAFLGGVGLSIPAGENGRSVLEQIWSRPTCEVNGIMGGYTGDGIKTVIPSSAFAKITCRLVVEQDPLAIRDAVKDFVRNRVPGDCSVEFIEHGAGAAIAIDTGNPHVVRAASALRDEFGRDAVMLGSGGSIPVVESFRRILGMESLLIGFGLDGDRVHSPNEKYSLSSFHRGIRSWARVLDSLG